MQIDLPGGMEGKTIGQAINGPGQGVQAPILARVPRMSGAGVPVPLHNQVQGGGRLHIEGQRVAEPFPVGKAVRWEIKVNPSCDPLTSMGFFLQGEGR
jgi:hypothetical protein